MKNKFLTYTSILLVFVLHANTVFWVTYKEKFTINSTYLKVSQEKISQARVLQSYIIEYKKNINKLYSDYNTWESKVMQDANEILNTMANSLESIQKRSVNPDIVPEVFQSISEDLQKLNTKMKIYLEQEKIISKQEIELKKQLYIASGKKISEVIDLIIIKVSRELNKLSEFNETHKKIVTALVELQNIKSSIQDFSQKNYSSIKEMEDFFRLIAKDIRKQISIIKNP